MKPLAFLGVVLVVLVLLAFAFSYLLYSGFGGKSEVSLVPEIIEIESPKDMAGLIATQAFDDRSSEVSGIEKSRINEDYIVTMNDDESGDRVDLIIRGGEVYAYSVNYDFIKQCSVFYDEVYCS